MTGSGYSRLLLLDRRSGDERRETESEESRRYLVPVINAVTVGRCAIAPWWVGRSVGGNWDEETRSEIGGERN